MQNPPNADGPPRPPAVSYAGVLQRAAAIFVDTTLLLVIAELLAPFGVGESIFTLDQDTANASSVSGTIIWTLLAAVYFIVLNGRGATVGKRLLGIRVIDERGLPPGLRRAAIRHVIPLAGGLIPQLAGGLAETTESPELGAVAVTFAAGGLIASVALLVAAYDALSMLWHPRRQTLHDRMAGTFVVPVAQGALVPPGQSPARLRPVIVIVLTLLLLCVATIVSLAPQAERWFAGAKDEVANVMASQLEASCIDSIEDNGAERERVRLLDRDLTVNNVIMPGEVGWESGTEGTFVFGMDIHFLPDRIALNIGQDQRYSGAPIVNGGQVELVDIQVPEQEMLLSDEAFERVVGDGLNGCLEFHSLDPAALSVDDDVMIVEVTAAP